MPFKAILNELVEATPGATGAILADWEGEAVVQHCLYDDYELKVIAAHQGILLNCLKDAHECFPGGELVDMVITAGNTHILSAVIGPDYTLVMTLDREAMVSRARYRFRRTAMRLEKEIY